MHSSRMRTVRCSDRRGVSAQGVSAQGGVSAKGVCLAGGVSAQGECLPTGGVASAQGGKGVSAQRGYLPRGDVSQHALRQTPRLCGQNDRQV